MSIIGSKGTTIQIVEESTMDIRTESRNLKMTPRWQDEIEARLHDLQEGHGDIIHARVTLEIGRAHV